MLPPRSSPRFSNRSGAHLMALSLGTFAAFGGHHPAAVRAQTSAPSPPNAARLAAAPSAGPPSVSVGEMVRRGPRYVAPMDGGGEAILTLEPRLQELASETLESYAVPFGAAVVVSVPDGRVLALVGRSALDAALGPEELALRPWAPAASVFKVVTAAALVGEAGLSADSRVCYHGGVSAVLANNLLDMPKLDSRCDTLAFGLAKSQNAILAKLAAGHLAPASLTRVTRAFGFGAPLPFDAEVAPSDAFIPSNQLEFARAAAGFWHTSLSVLHGALIAAAIANQGEMPMPRLVERAVDAGGRPVAQPRRLSRRVVNPEVAREVAQMMVLTTTVGTARGTFRDRRGQRILPIDVAGKTGSLAYRGEAGDPALPAAWPADTYLGYSWFIGFAPATAPKIAFAVLLANRELWHIKAPFLARRLVAEQLASSPGEAVARARPAPRLAAR